jgi:hypothetical protein
VLLPTEVWRRFALAEESGDEPTSGGGGGALVLTPADGGGVHGWWAEEDSAGGVIVATEAVATELVPVVKKRIVLMRGDREYTAGERVLVVEVFDGVSKLDCWWLVGEEEGETVSIDSW